MNSFALIFFLANAIVLLRVPRKWAALPLLITACYMSRGEGIEIGVISLPMIRLILMVGFVRVILRGEIKGLKIIGLDKLMFIWAVFALLSSVFHENSFSSLVNRLGIVYNNLGIYFLIRILCTSMEEIIFLYRIIGILLLPLSVELLRERITGYNLFSVLGGVSEGLEVRLNGTFRAEGPFSHSILAGTVGAICLPLAIGLWKHYRRESIIGIFSCVLMVYASNSTGPIMSLCVSITGMMMWKFRYRLRSIYWLLIIGYLLLLVIMNDPPYYILAKIDIAGGSAGWFRARLIESAIEHLSEWWLWGTDYTRHWMPSGVQWSAKHTDITNYYLKMGVQGGLLLMIIFFSIIIVSFLYIEKSIKTMDEIKSNHQYLSWALWAMLLSNSVTCIAISYYDQSFIFLYLNFATIGSIRSIVVQYS